MKKLFVFMLAMLCFCQVAFADEISNPAPQTDIYLNDGANMLSADAKDQLLTASKDLHEQTGAQFVIVTVPSLNGQSIEEYSNDLFNNWGIGDKDKNNGVLLLISKDDKKFRIEVGSGLEGTLTDAYCNNELSILKDNFKKGDFDTGVLTVSKDICSSVSSGEEVTSNSHKLTEMQKEILLVVVILLIIIILFLFSSSGSSSSGGFYGGSSSSSSGSSSSSSFGGGSSDGGGCSGGW
jgi:uncharacterized protein